MKTSFAMRNKKKKNRENLNKLGVYFVGFLFISSMVAIAMIILGIICMIQPIKLDIFRWGFNIVWIGLIIYIIFSHIKS